MAGDATAGPDTPPAEWHVKYQGRGCDRRRTHDNADITSYSNIFLFPTWCHLARAWPRQAMGGADPVPCQAIGGADPVLQGPGSILGLIPSGQAMARADPVLPGRCRSWSHPARTRQAPIPSRQRLEGTPMFSDPFKRHRPSLRKHRSFTFSTTPTPSDILRRHRPSLGKHVFQHPEAFRSHLTPRQTTTTSPHGAPGHYVLYYFHPAGFLRFLLLNPGGIHSKFIQTSCYVTPRGIHTDRRQRHTIPELSEFFIFPNFASFATTRCQDFSQFSAPPSARNQPKMPLERVMVHPTSTFLPQHVERNNSYTPAQSPKKCDNDNMRCDFVFVFFKKYAKKYSNW